jgi:hypothetical protein
MDKEVVKPKGNYIYEFAIEIRKGIFVITYVVDNTKVITKKLIK